MVNSISFVQMPVRKVRRKPVNSVIKIKLVKPVYQALGSASTPTKIKKNKIKIISASD